jgi:hypothetical protein
MLKKLFFLIILPVFYFASCYYQYSYKLIKPDRVVIPFDKLSQDGENLIKFFDEKYIYVLGVVDNKDKIILFDKRKPPVITADGKIHAFSLSDDELTISLKNVKYFYLKRRMPDTEQEAAHP